MLNINPNIILNTSSNVIIIMLSFSPSNHPFLFDFFPFINPVINDDSKSIINSIIMYVL